MNRWQRSVSLHTHSVPSVVKQVPEGFLVVDPNQQWSWSRFLLFLTITLFWNGLSLFAFFALLPSIAYDPSIWIGLAIIGLFVVIGLGLLAAFIYNTWLISRLRPGELILPRYPLRMGEVCIVRFRRQLRSGRTTQAGRIEGIVLCYEWVRYRRGTDYETATHTVWEVPLPTKEIYGGVSRLDYDTEIKIPGDGPPTFTAPNNQIRWELKVLITVPGIGRDTSNFRLTVEPEVVT